MRGRWLRRLLAIVLVVVLVAVVAGAGTLALFFGRALPQTGGVLRVAGLSAPVTVYRDAAGITQIVADTPDDLFFAQGFVHASERMWQMEVWRHITSGRLSEIFDTPAVVDQDKFIRTLGWRQAGEADYAAAPARTRRALDQYAAGVNAWLAQNAGKLNFGFTLAGLNNGTGGLGGYAVEPWTGADSTTFAKLQAWQLGGNVDVEIFKAVMDSWFGGKTAMTNLLTPGYQPGMPVVEPTTKTSSAEPAGAPVGASVGAPASAASGPLDSLLAFAKTSAALGAISGLGTGSTTIGASGIGSNDWVVAPSRSADGHALLANDPHLGISMPSVWFMNGLRCRVVSDACPYDVAGVSFPGTPAVILGHNSRIAWGATNVNPDVQDLFVETPDPSNPANYMYKGQSVPYTVRTETLNVVGEGPIALTVRSTVHGPVISDLYPDLKSSGKVYALRWTATVPGETDGLLDAFIGIDQASNWQQFRDALRSYGAPSQNFVYADVDGNIGWQVPGKIPVRPAGNTGDRPVDGSTGANDWTGYVPFDQLPNIYNPPSGMIVTANNAVVDAGYPYLLGTDWDPGYRAKRITELLAAAAARGGVTQADLSAVQNDAHDNHADSVVPALVAALPTTTDGKLVQSLISTWDLNCTVESRGCAAYEVTDWQLQDVLFRPWLGTQLKTYVGSDHAHVAMRIALGDAGSPLWDDPSTPAKETRADRLAAALDSAGAQLRAALGDPARWSWGQIHRATFRELTLGAPGSLPGPLSSILNTGPIAVGGTADAVNATSISLGAWYPDPTDASAKPGTLFDAFAANSSPSYRLAIDMGNLDGARIIDTTGQSGNPMDRHYGDLVNAWAHGQSLPFPFSAQAVEAAAAATLTLCDPSATDAVCSQ